MLDLPRTGRAAVPERSPFLTITALERYSLACAATVLTAAGIFVVHPQSIAHFTYFFFLWVLAVGLLHRQDTARFAFAFLINSAFIALFFVVQTAVFPDSYGTTSPDSWSWTDDSHFFSLLADELPANLLVRDQYFLYTHTFSTLIRVLMPLPIVHPMDAIFFQSGTAALLATFTRRFTLQLSGDRQLGDVVFAFTVACPFLMMNGGVVLLRDTLAAALLIYSLSCLLDRRLLLALGAVLLQLALRPGTGLILLPAYLIIFGSDLRAFARRHQAAAPLVLIGVPLVVGATVALLWDRLVGLAPDLFAVALASGATVDLFGREVFDDLAATDNANVVFLAVQDLPYVVKLIVNGAYMFAYPFLSPRHAFTGTSFDLRGITMNLLVPVYALWLNAWFIAGAVTRQRAVLRQVGVVAAVIVSLLLIGTYSLQSRHKTILYPLFYIVVAIGLCRATPAERRFGYWCSGLLLLLQVLFIFR